MKEHKAKHHRNSTPKQATENHIRATALKRSVTNNWELKDIIFSDSLIELQSINNCKFTQGKSANRSSYKLK